LTNGSKTIVTALIATMLGVLGYDTPGIGKNKLGQVERDGVLLLIRKVLFLVPFKIHSRLLRRRKQYI
jgi:hypothetical protein